MQSLLITHIGMLIGVGEEPNGFLKGAEMDDLKVIPNAWLLIEKGLIHSYGPMEELGLLHAADVFDAKGRSILPAWADSHTHLVFPASREAEFVDRINGLSYAEIAARGGGILNTAERMALVSESQLLDMSCQRLEQVMRTGTGAIEIKSGYGLNTEGELKMLRVIRSLKEKYSLPIKATFLAAHAYPGLYRDHHEGYLREIIDDMLPMVASEGLADYVDVFCEDGFFSPRETSLVLEAAAKYGLKPKIHANQLGHSSGVEVGIAHHAVSVDHLEFVGPSEINALSKTETIPTLLPGAAFFLGMQYQPARQMIDAGLGICLATDYNPGSCPSGNVPLLLSIACTQLKITPNEAINAVTINGAAALELQRVIGSIAVGKQANLILTSLIPSVAYIPYDFGNNPVEKLILQGRFV
jgi:imidazolonepropionase